MGLNLILHGLVQAFVRRLSQEHVRQLAVRWLPYYVAKYAIIRSTRQYGAFRLYRRAVEGSASSAASDAQRRAFLNAIKAAMRAPSRCHALATDFQQQLWQWLRHAEHSAGTSAKRDDVSHTQCAVDWQQTRRDRLLKGLLTASAKLLLLSSGSRPPPHALPPPPPSASSASPNAAGRHMGADDHADDGSGQLR